MTEKLGYTVKEAAAALGVSRNTVYMEVAAGRLKAARIGSGGRIIRIGRAALDEWLAGDNNPGRGTR